MNLEGPPFSSLATITQGYSDMHKAHDATSQGSRIIVACERAWLRGTRSAVGTWAPAQGRQSGNAGYGNVVYLEHGTRRGRITDWTSRYAHLASFAPRIEAWLQDPSDPIFIDRGEQVGVEGNSGFVYSSTQVPGATPHTLADGRVMWLPPVDDSETARHLHFELIDGAQKKDYQVALPALTAALDALEQTDLAAGDADTARAQIQIVRAVLREEAAGRSTGQEALHAIRFAVGA
jgi:murein DD-endopeptidase MepM/ murein hydrolase activator NlpD